MQADQAISKNLIISLWFIIVFYDTAFYKVCTVRNIVLL